MGKYITFVGNHLVAIALALSIFSGLSETTSAQSNGVPVMVGGEADFDACGSTGRVVGLNSAGDNFLAVRQGPAGSHEMIDKLHTGNDVYMCDAQGDWVGIVYSTMGNQDCGVSSPIARKQAYSGRCKSGWVHRRFITLIAG